MKKCIIALALVVTMLSANAQKFHAPFTLGNVKDATVTLVDGTTLTDVRVKKLKTKKGIAKMVGFGSETVETKTYKTDQIKHIVGKPKGLAKLGAATGISITNATNTDYGSLAKDALVYEQATMPKGSKVKVTMLQVLNPEFSSKIKVYADPLQKKSAGFAGGLVGRRA